MPSKTRVYASPVTGHSILCEQPESFSPSPRSSSRTWIKRSPESPRPTPDAKPIPLNPRYLINKAGDIWDIKTRRPFNVYHDRRGSGNQWLAILANPETCRRKIHRCIAEL